jgi:hypothetical protein
VLGLIPFQMILSSTGEIPLQVPLVEETFGVAARSPLLEQQVHLLAVQMVVG